MKRSSSWSNAHTSSPSLRAHRPPYLVLFALCLLTLLSEACAPTSPIPSQFEAFERIPIHTVTVHEQRIAYLDVGTGPPIILIHGFGGSMWQWEHQQHALAEHFRVLTLDLPGSGLSDKPDIEYRPDQMLGFLVGFMDTLEIPHATLVGNSMGAGLAIAMTLEHPARVAKLVLIGGLPPQVMQTLTSPSIRRALETRAPVWLISLGNRLFGGLMTESVLREIVHDPALLTPAVVERANRNRRRPGLIGPLLAAQQALPLWESGFALRIGTVTHPTLVIWGEEDRVFPIAVGEELHRAISGSRFVRIPHAGHLPQWERPGLVNRSLIEYIQHQ
jgi:pimeloyl-ACP methyl ester carboxylesterase